MKRLTLKQISDAFAAQSKPDSASDTKGFQRLSAALHDLQQAGIDVELELFGKSSEKGFKMKFASSVESVWQSTGGILRIGNFQSLVAIFTELKMHGQEKQPCFWLKVSDLDIRYEHENSTIRHSAFDLLDDADALVSFQQFVIGIAANQKRIADADIHTAFQPPHHTTRNNRAAPAVRIGKKTTPLIS